MNVTELARQVRIPTSRLREILPDLGYDIGIKAIKVDEKTANKIIAILNKPEIREKYLNTGKKTEEKKEEEKTEGAGRKIRIGETVVVKELAVMMGIDVTKLILELMKNGVMASLTQSIDYDTASIIASDFGFEVEKDEGHTEIDWEKEKEERKKHFADDKEKLSIRPPVIVVMGHVDHGKTKLLDAIRETNVVDTESGGITQHIGAYQVEKSGQQLTFIDTPGHEAFSTMRSRGAQVADIAILVVAADDGVQPQTIEALSHAKSAGLPLVVAINKIDKENANIDKIKTELSEIGLTPEDWGGDTITVEISAKEGINIDGLLETLLLVYEIEKGNIQGNPNRGAVGTIIESHVDKGMGPVATCLVQTGMLDQGDIVKIGNVVSKIRSLTNWKGEIVKQAGPSTPVQMLGLKKIAQVGDILSEITDKKEIRKLGKLANKQKHRLIEQGETKNVVTSNDEDEKETKNVNIILKADVFGSIEAIIESLDKIKDEEVVIDIIKKGLGNITDSDVEQAADLNAVIIGFHVKTVPAAEKLASNKDVEIIDFEIIYDLIDFVKGKVEDLISPDLITTTIGKLKVLKLFKDSKKEKIVGGRVIEGKIKEDSLLNIWRGENLLGQGTLKELQSAKEKIKEGVEGQECGMSIETTVNIAEDDVIEFYSQEKKARKL